MALKSVEHLMVVDNDEAVEFKTYKKTELDEEENTYPLLYMKLDRQDFIELFKKLIIMNMKKEQQTVHLG